MGKHLLFEAPDGLFERLVLGKDHLHLGSSLTPAAAACAACGLLSAWSCAGRGRGRRRATCCEHLLWRSGGGFIRGADWCGHAEHPVVKRRGRAVNTCCEHLLMKRRGCHREHGRWNDER